jgi:hypothetical protein
MLRFWASMEVYKPASAAAETVRRRVEPFLNAAFAASSLATLEGELRYVPIIMPEDMHARYPERSTLRKRERIYDCAPWLNYEVFANGTFGDQLREYLRGIATSAQQLPGLGATPRQVADFEAIVATAVEDILADWSVRTRHSVAESDTEHVWPISNADMIQVDDCADYKITASELMRTPALPHLSYLRNNGLVFVPFPEREALDHYADRIWTPPDTVI